MLDRRIEPELLDYLAPHDPAARRSRADLRRLNTLIGSVTILARALDAAGWRRIRSSRRRAASWRRHIVDLGGGDGTLLWRLARRGRPSGTPLVATLVDRQPVIDRDLTGRFATVGWEFRAVQADVFEYLEQTTAPKAGAMIANLFLHHFTNDDLRRLFSRISSCAEIFASVEPRRARGPLTASRLVRWIGCNAVTRHDAVASVRAGFSGGELAALWPRSRQWRIVERPAGWCSHLFVAVRVR